MATLSLKSAGPKFTDFLKKWHFFAQIVFISDFSVQIQRLKLTLEQNFSQIGQKIKGLEFRPRTIAKTTL